MRADEHVQTCGLMSTARRARILRLLAPALAALLAACAQLPTRPTYGPIADVPVGVAAPATTALSAAYASAEARRDTALRVWKVIDERFYDPGFNGVDWAGERDRFVPRAAAARSDAEFYAALKAMVASLRDSHTLVLTPRETVDRRNFVAPRLGIGLGYVEGRVAIVEVDPGSPAAAAGLRPGDVLRAVDDTRFDGAFLRRALRAAAADSVDAQADVQADARPRGDGPSERVLRAAMRAVRDAIGTAPQLRPVHVEVERDGGLAEATLTATLAPRPPRAELRWLEGDLALVRFTRFLPEVRAAVEQELAEAQRARALIVDLRGNGGGLFDFYRWFVGRFLPAPRTVLRAQRREGISGEAGNSDVRAGGGAGTLVQPLAVLIDAGTASAAELAAVTLAEQRGALLVGDETCGCVVGVRAEYVLPDGGGVRVAETGFISARGAKFEGHPIVPAVRVAPRLADLRAGRDAALEEAQRRLRTKLQ